MIFGADTRPVAPAEIVKRLKQVDERLDLQFVSMGTIDPLMGGDVQAGSHDWWAIVLRWRQQDPRRKMIDEGMMSPDDDYEILSFLPMDCTPDQAYGFLVNHLKQVRGKEDARYLLENAAKFNQEQIAEEKEKALELAIELVKTNAPTLMKELGKDTPRVYQSGGKKK